VPLAVERIMPEMSLDMVRQMIAESIKKLIDEEEKDPKAAAGQAYSMAASLFLEPTSVGRSYDSCLQQSSLL